MDPGGPCQPQPLSFCEPRAEEEGGTADLSPQDGSRSTGAAPTQDPNARRAPRPGLLSVASQAKQNKLISNTALAVKRL